MPRYGKDRAMPTLYNLIQGRNVDRLAALSDGIFAFAMTLLVIDLHLPTAAQVHSEGELIGLSAPWGRSGSHTA